MERNIKVPVEEKDDRTLRDRAIESIRWHVQETQRMLDLDAEAKQRDAELELKGLLIAGMHPSSRMFDVCIYLSSQVVWSIEDRRLICRMTDDGVRIAKAAQRAGLFEEGTEGTAAVKDTVYRVGDVWYTEGFRVLSRNSCDKAVAFKIAKDARKVAEQYRQAQLIDKIEEPEEEEEEWDEDEDERNEMPF